MLMRINWPETPLKGRLKNEFDMLMKTVSGVLPGHIE
jgi:hypothetical protein